MSDELTVLGRVAIWALPVLFAVTVHEVAHGWVALQLGDSTAYYQGRLTLNPLKHIDPLGTVILPLILLALGGFVFGWAKPVPVNWLRLRHPSRDIALVALAGPGANLGMALSWAIIAKIGWMLSEVFEPAEFLLYVGQAGILINCILMIFNMLPILPLDGGRVLNSVLPRDWAIFYERLEPYGLFILLLLLATHALDYILSPMVLFSYNTIAWIVSW